MKTKHTLLFTLLLMISCFAFGQSNQPYFAARANINSAPTDMGGGVYQVTANISDETGFLDGLDMDDDSTFYLITTSTIVGDDINLYRIDTITSQFAGSVTFKVDIGSQPAPNTGIQAICQKNNAGIFPIPSGVSSALQQAITQYNSGQMLKSVPKWDDEITYDLNDIISHNGSLFNSIVNNNLNNSPSSFPGAWLNISSNSDSTRLRKDSIMVYYQGGIEIGRDTIPISGASGVGGNQTLSYNAPTDEITISAGNTIDITEVNTDNQTLDVAQLSGTDLQLSLSGDGEATKVIDLSPIQGSGTDDQQVTTFSINANTLTLEIEDDGQAPHTVDLSPYLDNTDTQLTNEQVEDIVGAMVSGNTETLISVTYDDVNGVYNFVVEGNLSNFTNDAGFLTSEVDGSTSNELQTLSYNSTTDEITISSGNTIDITEVDTDNQVFDVSQLSGTELQLSLSNDGEATKAIDLSSLQDGTGTDDQQVTSFSINANTLTLELENDGQAPHTVDLSSYLDNTDTQLTQEQVQDFVGTMVTGNTETLISVTYDDVSNIYNFVVEGNLSNYTNDAGFLTSEADGSTTNELDTLGFQGDSGGIIERGDGENLNIFGVFGINTSGAGSTISIEADTSEVSTLTALQDTAAAIRGDFPSAGGIYGGDGSTEAVVTLINNGITFESSDTDPLADEDFVVDLYAGGSNKLKSIYFNNENDDTYTSFGCLPTGFWFDADDSYFAVGNEFGASGLLAYYVGQDSFVINDNRTIKRGANYFALYPKSNYLSTTIPAWGNVQSEISDSLAAFSGGIQDLSYTTTTGAIGITGGTGITIPVMTGATSGSDGEIGLVPKALAGEESLFLRADGTYANPSVGGDNWGGQVVQSDNTLSGDGTSGDQLKVDTTIIASLSALQDSSAAIRGDFPVDTDTQLSQEQVEDFVGGMVTGNTETLITVTYQDGDGTVDFEVNPNLSNYTNDAGFLTSEVDGSTSNELQTLSANDTNSELTISSGNTVDLSEFIQEEVFRFLISGTGIGLNYDDFSNALEISSTVTGTNFSITADAGGTETISDSELIDFEGDFGVSTLRSSSTINFEVDTSEVATLTALQDSSAAIRADFPSGGTMDGFFLSSAPGDGLLIGDQDTTMFLTLPGLDHTRSGNQIIFDLAFNELSPYNGQFIDTLRLATYNQTTGQHLLLDPASLYNYFIDGGPGQAATGLRIEVDYSSDDAVTNYFTGVSPSDSVRLYNYDGNNYLFSSTGLTIDANTDLTLGSGSTDNLYVPIPLDTVNSNPLLFSINPTTKRVSFLEKSTISGGGDPDQTLSWDNVNNDLTISGTGGNTVEITGFADDSHASTHINGGGDEIDGDQIDIDFVPSTYSRTTLPSEVDNIAELTAHLSGIDNYLDVVETDNVGSQTSSTLDWGAEQGRVIKLDMTGLSSISLTLSNPRNGGVYTVLFMNADDGDTVTWPGAAIYETGAAIGTDALSSGRRMFTMVYDGTNYYVTGGY